ncbi:MAG TPA: SpoIIE family protein phosphatase, partial [Myxococcaceae bacterium]|nr:SpoIIE family protein phosphatase [Myxococcaceae bacterium]
MPQPAPAQARSLESYLTERGWLTILQWGWAGHAFEEPSGDVHLVVPFDGGVLVALLDGLGHGREAAAASASAAAVLEANAGEPAPSLVRRCHFSLRHTRGAVMSLASFNWREGAMTWIGVGDVEAVLLRAPDPPGRSDETLSRRGGVMGFQLPPLRSDTLTLCSGDTLIMATDGIRTAFSQGIALDR